MTENAPAHTPGPWIVDDDGFVYDANGHQEQPICDTRCFDTNPDNMAEIDANARLIAAAPDLLAALRQLQRLFGPADPASKRGAAYAAADAAIAKATGNSQDAAGPPANAARYPVADATANAPATGNSQDVPAPAPGTDATTADGRFVSGSGYGGERM